MEQTEFTSKRRTSFTRCGKELECSEDQCSAYRQRLIQGGKAIAQRFVQTSAMLFPSPPRGLEVRRRPHRERQT